MAARQENDFELVIGNRQLFSVLGIVVILLGIFFAMGFFAGKSVGQQSAVTEAAAKRRPMDTAPLVVDQINKSAPPTQLETAVPTETRLAEEPAKAVEPESKPAAKPRQETKPEPAIKAAKPAPPPERAPDRTPADQVREPAAGSYLQVAATRLSEAQSLAALLRKNGFRVAIAPSAKTDLVRVVVGPFTSAEAANEARTKLKSLGIDRPVPKKY